MSNAVPSSGPATDTAATNYQTTSATSSIGQRLSSGMVWILGSRVLGSAAALASNSLLARMMELSAFGQFVALVSLMFLLQEITKFGLDRALLRHLSEHSESSSFHAIKQIRNRCFRLLLLTTPLSIGISITCFYFAVGFADFWHDFLLLAVLLCGVLVQTSLLLNAESLRELHDLKYCSLFNAQKTAPSTATIFLLAVSTTYLVGIPMTTGLALGEFVLTMFCVLLLSQASFWKLASRIYPPNDEHSTARSIPSVVEIFSASISLVFLDMINACWEGGEPFIAQAFLKSSDVAFFGASTQMISLVIMPTFLALQMIRSYIPLLYSQREFAKLERILRSFAGAISFVTLLPWTVLFLFADPIMGLIFGPEYAPAGNVLRVLLVGRVATFIFGTAPSVLLFTGRQNIMLVISIFSILIMFILIALFSPTWGLIGFATAGATARTIAYVGYWIAAKLVCGIWTHPSFNFLSRIPSIINRN